MFTKALLFSGLAALAAAQSSVLTFTHVPDPITDGEAQAITYATNDTSSPVTIILRQGESNNLQTIETLTTDATGGQYIWTPSKSLADGSDYALEIKQGTQVNYFGPFEVQGQSNSAVSSASASSASSTASANSTGTGVPVGGATGTANSTSSGSANATSTGTGVAGGPTGRNSTAGPNSNSNSTMTSTASSSGQMSTGGPASLTSAAGSSGAGFQSSATGAASASSTGSSSAGAMSASTSISMVLGALGALMYFL